MKYSKVALTIFIGLVLLMGLVIAANYIKSQLHIHEVKVAIGKKGDAGEQIFTTLSSLFIENNIPIKLIPIVTKGSVENAELVQSGEAEIGLAVLNAAKGSQLRTVALLYPQINHLVVRSDSNARSLADLKGKKIATSKKGGGTYTALLSLLKYYNMTPEDVTLQHMSSSKFSNAFLSGQADAIFYNDSPGSKKIAQSVANGKGKLLPLDDFQSLNMFDPFLEEYLVPEGLYKAANPKIPTEELHLVSYQTALITNASTKKVVIKNILDFLFDYQSVIRESVPLISFLKKPTKEFFGPVFHPAAQNYYAGESPSFLQKYNNEISFAFAILPIVLSLWFALKSKLQTKRTELISSYHQDIQQALLTLIETSTLPEVKAVEANLHTILSQFMDDQGKGKVNQDEESRFSFAWEKSMQLTKEKIQNYSTKGGLIKHSDVVKVLFAHQLR